MPQPAIFFGDLNQVHVTVGREEPGWEPKVDAIRGTAAIIRRFSAARAKAEPENLMNERLQYWDLNENELTQF